MKKIIAIVLMAIMLVSVFALCVSADAADEKKTAHAIYGTPVIDGVKDAIWDKAQINVLENVYLNNDFTQATCRFRAMYDSDYLYFYVEVEDHTMGDLSWELQQQGGNLWRRDGVGFVFSPDHNTEDLGTLTAPAFWYIIAAHGTTANWQQAPANVFLSEAPDFVIADANKMVENADGTKEFEVKDRMYVNTLLTDASGNLCGYTIECKVNLIPQLEKSNSTYELKLQAGTVIGFDMYLNDNNRILMEAGRSYGLCWSEVTSYHHNNLKGDLVLDVLGMDYTIDNEKYLETTVEDTTTEAPVDTTDPVAVDTTTDPAEVTTDKPKDDETTKNDTPVATTPADDTPTKAPVTTKAPDEGWKKGCGSFAGVAVIAVMALLGTAVTVVKKVY